MVFEKSGVGIFKIFIFWLKMAAHRLRHRLKTGKDRLRQVKTGKDSKKKK